jgi:hypothetical protein
LTAEIFRFEADFGTSETGELAPDSWSATSLSATSAETGTGALAEWPGAPENVVGHVGDDSAELRLPKPPRSEAYRLELMLCANSAMSATVALNGTDLARLDVRKVSCFSLYIPPWWINEPNGVWPDGTQGAVTIRFADLREPLNDHNVTDLHKLRTLRLIGTTDAADGKAPAADAPALPRPLPPPPEGLSDRDLMLRFLSLGDQCELGLVQRHYGADPLDLYRFSSVPLGWVIEGIDREFAGIGNPSPDAFFVGRQRKPDGQDYFYTYQRTYRIDYETGIRADLIDVETLRADVLNRFVRLGRKLIEDLAEGTRIAVIRRDVPYSWHETEAISRRIRRHGDCGLLIVEVGDRARPAGFVEVIAPGVMKGYLDRLARPDDVAGTTVPQAWLDLCRKAYRIWWHMRAGKPSPATLPADFSIYGYLQRNPDVALAGFDPRTHFLAYGVHEGRRYAPPPPPATPPATPRATPAPDPLPAPVAAAPFGPVRRILQKLFGPPPQDR